MIAGQRIGLLGGSFNPAHEGHLHLSLEAKRRLNLDKIIWLVSPQNPLKSREGMAEYATRLASARKITQPYPFIEVSDLEAKHKLYFSIDTIEWLRKRAPKTHFVWLMGADNLANFHRWRGWRRILRFMPIAVFDRAPYSHHALHQKAALTYKNSRLDSRLSRHLALASAPCWCYLFMPRHPQSSTKIRKRLGETANL